MTTTPGGYLPGPRLIVGVETTGPWQVIELSGELDVATAPALIDQASKLLAVQDRPQLALELSQVTFCDSSGLNAFVRLWKRASAARGELVLVRPGRWVADLLARTGLDAHMRVLGTLDDAPEDEPEDGPAAPQPA